MSANVVFDMVVSESSLLSNFTFKLSVMFALGTDGEEKYYKPTSV